MAVTNWSEALESIVKMIQEGLKKGDVHAFELLDAKLTNLRKELREVIQAITKKDIIPIVQKLKKTQKLEPRELQLVRLWIVGDAEYYVTHENNFPDWMQEAARIQAEIKSIQTKTPTAENSAHLQALLLDLDRTTSDIVFYLKQKARVDRFKESTKEIDADEARTLAEMLETKLLSDGV